MDSAVNKSARRGKVFKERVSLFDHLCQVNPYFNGLYSCCKIQFGLFIVYILARNSFRARRFHLDFSKDALLLGGARDWGIFIGMECVQLLAFVLVYFVFLVWVGARQWLGKVASLLFFAFCGAYMVGSFYFVWFAMHEIHIAPIPRLVVYIEQIRLSMKMYSFVRENSSKVLHPWHKDDDFGPAVWYAGQMSPRVGSISQYLYFLVAPTVLYRDHYPRNRGSINWTNVFLYGTQFLGAYVVARFMFAEVLFPASMRLDDLVDSYIKCFLFSPFMSFLACILVLNAWFNFTAELTRFGDREFYQNWWSAISYAEYFRTWNVPVYSYLHTYIYQEIRSVTRYRGLAVLPGIIMSSFLHDFFVGVSTGFFFPVFLFLFATLGGIVMVTNVKFTRTLTFFFTCVGALLFESFYYTEIAARYYCPKDDLGQLEFRMFHCYQEFNNHSMPVFDA